MRRRGVCTWLLLVMSVMCNLQKNSQAKETSYSWGSVTSRDYCDYEVFKATCAPGETITIGAASYGHLAVGRCVEFDTGQLGCQADAAHVLSERCDGRLSCEVTVDDEALRAISTCRKGVILYLHAAYACVKTIPKDHLCQPTTASERTTYIASTHTKEASCMESFDNEYLVKAKPGQKISFSLINVRRLLAGHSSEYKSAKELGYILDPGLETITPIIGSDEVESSIATSRYNEATVFISPSPGALFLIGFKAIGCPDLQLSGDVMLHRERDRTTVSCRASRHTWQLHCRGNRWIGVIGNCSSSHSVMADVKQPAPDEWRLPLPKDIILVMIACGTLFMAVVVVTAGYVCLKWPKQKVKRKKTKSLRRPGFKHTKLQAARGSDIMYLTSRYSPDGEGDPMTSSDYQPIWEKPLPQLPSSEQSTTEVQINRNSLGTCNWNMTLSSTSADYEGNKYYVLDKDFVTNAHGTSKKL